MRRIAGHLRRPPAARRRRSSFAVALNALAFLTAAILGASAFGVEPIFWRQPVFFIPYQAAADPRAAANIKKIELMVAHGNVGDWAVLQEAEPHVRGFSYHAPADGEYSFALRLTDRKGNVSPAPITQPQLSVVVDTKPPAIQLDAAPDASGRVVVRYEARDVAIKPETIRLEVQTDGKTWQRTPLGPPDVSQPDRLLGQVAWKPTTPTGVVRFRAALEDRAGNIGSAVADATLASSANPFNSSPAPSTGPELGSPSGPSLSAPNVAPIANAPPHFDAPSTANAAPLAVAPTPPPFQNPYTSATTVAAPVLSGSPPSPHPDRTPAQLVADGTPRNDPQATSTPSATPQPTTDNSGGSDAPPLLNMFANNSPTGSQPLMTSAPVAPLDGAWSGATGGQVIATAPQPNNPIDPAAAGIRWVNSQTFDLDYDLQTVGPWGVAKVELWGTRDAGQTWTSFGADPDNRGPMRVAVPAAGAYGFRLLVTGANGTPVPAPQPGDKPELQIGVDLEAPQAELQAAQLGQGELADHLIIRWTAADANLEPRPIGLYFSGTAEGPWTMIASDLDNSGQYAWRLLRQVPEKFFLRLEVRDRAGNVTARQSAAPVALNLPQPTGKFRNVRPVAEDPGRYRTAAGHSDAH